MFKTRPFFRTGMSFAAVVAVSLSAGCASAGGEKPSPAPGERLLPITNTIGMTLVHIPPGEFFMGSPEGEDGRNPDEMQHRVRLTKGFHLGATEVTQKQWREVMGTTVAQQRDKANPVWALCGEEDGDPVYYVSWEEAGTFCERLSRKEGKKYRLPTEAEWEYACRAGTETPFHAGATLRPDQANYESTGANEIGTIVAGRQGTTRAGSFPPNRWGLFDMHGSVLEWCGDWEGSYPISKGIAVDPQGVPKGMLRVLRGGCWDFVLRGCRSATRSGAPPAYRDDIIGFRVALDS
ncbi:MAG: formylglycine-generating enzyme family protein [Planctomycetota bacterium]